MTTATSFIDRRLLAASWRSWTANDLQRIGPGWLQWVWTLVFCAGLSLCFTLLGAAMSDGQAWKVRALPAWALWYGKNFVVCLTIGGLIHLLFDAARVLLGGPQRVRRLAPWQRSLLFGGIPLGGLVVGWPIGIWLSGSQALLQRMLDKPGILTGMVAMSLALSLVMHLVFAARARQVQAERSATEAQLRLLQGQIEPHFLFNTLANVQALMDHDLPKARAMLQAFTDYLRGSLSQLRRDDSVLGMELDLAEAYLRLLQGRMDDRLRFSIHADDAARSVALPPLLLQPLVENAVVHGLEPQLNGGSVQIDARVLGGMLVVQVRDDGRGLRTGPRDSARHAQSTAQAGAHQGSGVAVENIVLRLQARYGTHASLQLQAASPGTLATLTLPIEDPRTP